jgi:hypothetical protein
VKSLNNKKGYSSVNVVVCVLIILSCFSLLIEMTALGKKYVYMPETATYIARTLAHQGGITTSTPDGYPDPSTYISSRSLYQKLSNQFSEEGFSSWALYINERRLTNFTSIEVPEKGQINVRLEGTLRPQFRSLWKNKQDVTIIAKRTVFSSFTPRKGDVLIVK